MQQLCLLELREMFLPQTPPVNSSQSLDIVIRSGIYFRDRVQIVSFLP